MQPDVDRWLREVLARIELALTLPNAPSLDLEWLILRCKDTLEYHGDVKQSSVDHLMSDLRQLAVEHPGLIPESLSNPSS